MKEETSKENALHLLFFMLMNINNIFTTFFGSHQMTIPFHLHVT